MALQPLKREEVTIAVEAEPEHIPVRGNALASGDNAFDREVENAILKRLDCGDVWAWATVIVSVSWKNLHGSAVLGCCCYEDEEDFRQQGGYFDDLVKEALAELNAKVADLHQALVQRERSRRN